MLIAFDGIDSSGKETQAKNLVLQLRERGHTVHTFQTPDYNTPSGKELKRLLQNENGSWDSKSWKEKMKLFATNRAENKDKVLKAIEQGEIVIYDRYIPSSLTFFTVEALRDNPEAHRSDIQNLIVNHEYDEHGMPREAVSIFLDVPPGVAKNMLEKRKETLQEGDEYTDHIAVQQRLYEEYAHLCASDPNHYVRISCIENDQLLAKEVIAQKIWRVLETKFPHLTTTTL